MVLPDFLCERGRTMMGTAKKEQFSRNNRISAGKIALALDVTMKTVKHWARTGHLNGLKTEGGHYRFLAPEITRFLAGQGRPMPQELIPARPRVAVLGKLPAGFPKVGMSVATDLAAGIMALGRGEFDVVVIGPDEITPAMLEKLVLALRRDPNTAGIGLVGLLTEPELGEAFLDGGGDLVVSHPEEVKPAIEAVLGRGEAPAGARCRTVTCIPTPHGHWLRKPARTKAA